MMDICPTGLLTDDHLDLLTSAAASWGLIASPPRAALARSELERSLAAASVDQAGRMLREENLAALRWLAAHGRSRLTETIADVDPYIHRPVGRVIPVEVIKAVQAAEEACTASPTWGTGIAGRLLTALARSATHRLDGYAEAPWHWTRPRRRRGRPIGIRTLGDQTPSLPGLCWIDPAAAAAFWNEAPIVLITPAAGLQLPGGLPCRTGVFMFVVDENHNQVWESLATLEMQALATFWPTCRDWLLSQLEHPAAEYVEHRSTS